MPSGTSRRLEMMGFSHDLNGRDVVRFLIEEGLGVLESHRNETNVPAPLGSNPREVG